MRAYLLGAADEHEAADLEASYFTDPAYLKWVQTLEDALISDYLDHRLTATETRRFEARYLVLPALRSKLDNASAKRVAVKPLARLFRFRLSIVSAVAITIIFATWFFGHNRAPAVLENARLAAEQQEVFSVRLSPGIIKGSGQTQEAVVPRRAARVSLTFEIPGHSTQEKLAVRVFSIAADGSRALVWEGDSVRSHLTGTGSEVTVGLEAATIPPADYIAEVGPPQGSNYESYSFRVSAASQ